MAGFNRYVALALVIKQPTNDISFADFDIFTNKVRVVYGIDKTRKKQKRVIKQAPKDFIEWISQPFLALQEFDVCLKSYLKRNKE